MTGFREPIQGNVPYYLDLQVKERIEKLKVHAVERLELIRKKHPEFDFTFKDHKGLSSVIRITCKKCGHQRELILSNITRDGFSDVCKVCARNAKYDNMLAKIKELIKKYPDWEICYHDRRFVKIKHKCGDYTLSRGYKTMEKILSEKEPVCFACKKRKIKALNLKVLKENSQYWEILDEGKTFEDEIKIKCRRCGKERYVTQGNLILLITRPKCKCRYGLPGHYDNDRVKALKALSSNPEWKLINIDDNKQQMTVKHICGEIKTYQVDSIVYPNDLICVPCRRANGMYRGY